MKIVLFIIKHERQWTWQAMQMNIKRLQQIHPLQIVVVGDVKDCDGYHCVPTENFPLGAKRQKGLEYVKTLGADYIIFSGMDHLVSDSLFEKYLELITQECEYIGFTDLYFFNKPTKQLFYSWGYTNNRTGEVQGVWRTLSKKALDDLEWKLYDEKTIYSLDKTFTNHVESLNLTSFTLRERNLLAIDIKEENTLNVLEDIESKHEVKQDILKNLSEQEYNYLMG